MTARTAAPLLECILALGLLFAWVPDTWAVRIESGLLLALAAAWLVFKSSSIALHWWLAVPLGAGLLGVAQIATASTVERTLTAEAALGWFAAAAAMFLGYECYGDSARAGRARRALVWFGVLLCLGAVLQFYTSPGKVFGLYETRRTISFGTIGYQNHFAELMEIIYPIALWFAVSSHTPVRYVVAAGVIAATTILSLSRTGGTLIVAETAVCLVWAYRGRWISRRVLALLAAGITAASVIFAMVAGWETFWEKLAGTHLDVVRMEIDRSALAMLRARPWTGFGLGTFTTVYPEYARYDGGVYVNAAHNDWLEWAADGGVPLLLLLAALALASTPRAVRAIWAAGIVAVFAHAFIDFPFQLQPLLLLVFAGLGMLAAGG